ncbi:MAG: dihydrolipoamide acetyltransferase family protein [Candidatus Dormibacteria bacterium]
MPDFRLPDLGEGITEGEVVEWRVEEGAQVIRDQVLVVIGTDKATVEIPSPFQGRVDAILAAAGAVVHVGDPLVRVDPGQLGDQIPASLPSEPDAPPGPRALPPAAQPKFTTVTSVPALPATRRAARELGIALDSVPGSGPAGRVRMSDLVVAGRRVALRGSRRVMAERMAEAHRQVPQVTVVLECDMGPVEALVRAVAADPTVGVGYSILGLMALAAVAGLRADPLFNASFDQQRMELEYHDQINLGIAVQAGDGLKVATLKHADQLAPGELQQQLGRLIAAARAGTLVPAELSGSTFTISSAGRLGGLLATPIVNWPNLAVLGVHAIDDRPVVREGRVTVGRVANLSLSFDHRVIDGLTASGFLYQLVDRLGHPESLVQ